LKIKALLIMTIREKLITVYAQKVGLPLFKRVFRSFKTPFSMEQLQKLPEGTLGKDLYHFMQTNKLELLPYFHIHDTKHLLLGYSTSLEDEACLQFFDLGNRYYTLPTFVSAAAFAVILPESWSKFRIAYKRGRAAKPIGYLHFEQMLELRTEELRTNNHLSTNS
jgi:ubiquinone biosynthesis protein Coq4